MFKLFSKPAAPQTNSEHIARLEACNRRVSKIKDTIIKSRKEWDAYREEWLAIQTIKAENCVPAPESPTLENYRKWREEVTAVLRNLNRQDREANGGYFSWQVACGIPALEAELAALEAEINALEA